MSSDQNKGFPLAGIPKFLKKKPSNEDYDEALGMSSRDQNQASVSSRDFANMSLDDIIAARNPTDAFRPKSYASTSRNQNAGTSGEEGGSIRSGRISLRQDIDPLTSSLYDLINKEVFPHGKGRGSKREGVGNMGEPGRIALRKDLDPLATSLDVLIITKKEVRPSGSGIGRGSKRKEVSVVEEHEMQPEGRMAVEQHQYPNVTAFRAVGFLSAEGMTIEIVIGRLKHDSGDRSHLWRCVITSGQIQGTSDSVRKVVAREMASNEFLIAISNTYKEVAIPKYIVMREILIDPRLFYKLEKEAARRGLEISHEVMVKPLPPTFEGGRRHMYYIHMCTYYVGQNKYTAENVIIEYAKLLAAKEAYFGLTGREPAPTVYFTGAECDPALEHNFGESEVFQHVARIDNEGRNYSLNAEEAQREDARREHGQHYKKTQAEEEKRRRHMAIQL